MLPIQLYTNISVPFQKESALTAKYFFGNLINEATFSKLNLLFNLWKLSEKDSSFVSEPNSKVSKINAYRATFCQLPHLVCTFEVQTTLKYTI